jgi:hypothetical protein
MRRARDAGVPGWIGLLIPLLFAANHEFWVYSVSLGFPFLAGGLRLQFPRYSVLALACIAALGHCLPATMVRLRAIRSFRWDGWRLGSAPSSPSTQH